MQVTPRHPSAGRRTSNRAANSPGARAHRIALRGMLLTLAVWFMAVVLHQIDIGGAWDPITSKTWLLIAAWLACFAAAFGLTLMRQSARRQPAAVTPPVGWINNWVMILAITSALGAVLVILDFAIFRGYGFSTAAAAIRAEETYSLMQGTVQSSAVSGLGRMLIPAILPCYLLAVCRWRDISLLTRTVLAVCSFFIMAEQLQFEGGRFFLTAAALIVLAGYFAFPTGAVSDGRAPRKRPFPYIRIALLTVVLLSFFSYVFVVRIMERDDFFWSAYFQFASNYQISVDYRTVGRFEGPFGPIWFSICMLWLYFTQGISELDLLLSVPYFNHAYGLYQLPQIAQIGQVLLGVDFRYDVVANLPTVGSYATFYGHNYVDFGNGGALISGAVLGFLTSRTLFGFASGRLDGWSLQAPIFLVFCLLSPTISLVTNLWPAMVWSAIVGASGRSWRRAS